MAAQEASPYGVTVALEASETGGTSRVDLEGPRPARASTFSALRSRDFRVFWYASLAFQIALTMQFFAIGWFVVQLAAREGVPRRAALYAGVVGLAISVPSLVVGIFTGVVIDRVDRRKVVLTEQSVALLSGAGMAALVVTRAANLGWVLVYSVITGTMGCFGRLARQAILPGLVGPARLTSAVVLNSSTLRFSVIVGPVIGGFLIGPLGVGGVLLVSASACVVALWSLALVPPQRTAETGQRPGMVASIRAGLVFMRDKTFVGWQLSLLAAVTMLANPLRDLLPAYANEVLDRGPVGAAWMAAAVGIGGLLATVVAPLVGARRGRGRVFVASSLGSGMVLVLFGVQRSLVPAFVLVAMVAFLMMGAAILSTMITQLTTPDALLGRVMGAQMLVVDLAIAVGTLLLGAAGSVIGVGAAMTIAGVLLTLAAVLVFARAPQLRAIP
jgi:predicted MFS family arabinose efflux permease